MLAMNMITPETLTEKFDSWLASCQKIIADYYAEHYSNLEVPQLSVEKNPRYWRVVETKHGDQRSVYCFIDPMTGDVLKSDGWKRPAKGARGNLFDDTNGMGRMTVYGAAYNR
jgi:hypothetical protein